MLDQKTTTSRPAGTDNRINQAEIKGSCLFWENNINELLCTMDTPYEAESQQEPPWSSLAVVSQPGLVLRKDNEPQVTQFRFTVHSPCRSGTQHWDLKNSSVREQIIVTHIVCMQHSEELRIGDELHSWRLQQQGDFLRIHRRKRTFPPNLWTKKTKNKNKTQNLINVVASTVYLTFQKQLQKWWYKKAITCPMHLPWHSQDKQTYSWMSLCLVMQCRSWMVS